MPSQPERVTAGELAAGLAARLETGLGDRRPGGPSGADRATTVVAIDGWSGSGKTHLAAQLAPALGAGCVHLDDFVPGWHGLTESTELLIAWVLRPLAAGHAARWQTWDWDADAFADGWSEVPAGGVVVVEGCGSACAPARRWVDAVIWMQASEDERRRRLSERADWATYEPWWDLWTRQEADLREGDDPAAAVTARVRTLDGDDFEVGWTA